MSAAFIYANKTYIKHYKKIISIHTFMIACQNFDTYSEPVFSLATHSIYYKKN